MPAVLLVKSCQPLNRVAIYPNCPRLPVQAEARDFGGLNVVGHSHNIDSEGLQFLGPLTFEVGHGGGNNVGKLITAPNSRQSEGAQEMGARITVSGRSVESHVSRVTNFTGNLGLNSQREESTSNRGKFKNSPDPVIHRYSRGSRFN